MFEENEAQTGQASSQTCSQVNLKKPIGQHEFTFFLLNRLNRRETSVQLTKVAMVDNMAIGQTMGKPPSV